MTELSVSVRLIQRGIALSRSDGEEFHLLWKEDGHAVLYHGKCENSRSPLGLVDLDRSIPDKPDRAKEWVLAYPNHPVFSG